MNRTTHAAAGAALRWLGIAAGGMLLAASRLSADPAPQARQVPQVVLQNGRVVPLSMLALDGDQYVVKGEVAGFQRGAVIPLDSVDHVFGGAPEELHRATALMLSGRPGDAFQLLVPIMRDHKDAARIPGNHWVVAARLALVAKALLGDGPGCEELRQGIAGAAKERRIEPFTLLEKALRIPVPARAEEREAALGGLAMDDLPAEVCALACFFRAELLQRDKRNAEALEAYLMIPCLFPSGGRVLTGMGQLRAAQMLAEQGRREEAVALVRAAIRNTRGTTAEQTAEKLLQTVK